MPFKLLREIIQCTKLDGQKKIDENQLVGCIKKLTCFAKDSAEALCPPPVSADKKRTFKGGPLCF